MPNNDDELHRYNLPTKKSSRVEPLKQDQDRGKDANAAADLLRRKIDTLHEQDEAQEPAAKDEQTMANTTPKAKRSKHQDYMHSLSTSGKSLAEIQAAWHSYYQSLPDHEKHEVWQEFYQQNHQPATEHRSNNHRNGQQQDGQTTSGPSVTNAPVQAERPAPEQSSETASNVKQRILKKAAGRSKRQQSNIKSLLFGLGMGGLVLLIATFGFFNERFIAPFITPSTVLSSTPLILDENGPVGDEPRIIIPKINVEVPVVYEEDSIAEDDVQQSLENGVLHYPITPEPGETGNSVIFGHSSNNILNSGDYKFAFVLLNQLEEDDTFMLEKDGVRYVYRVFDTEIVPPTDLSVLQPHPDKASTVTLITCDPPGTSINRLAVMAEQISPDPSENNESSADVSESTRPDELPSDAPTLWGRMFGD